MNELEEHVAVMLGGAGDIGSAAALEMAQHGAHVVLLDINSDSIDQAVERIESRGGHVTGEVVDALDFDAAADVLNAISERLGRIDFLSYLVGWIALRPSLEVPIDEFRRTLDVNLSAQFVWAQAVARIMPVKTAAVLLPSSVQFSASEASLGGPPIQRAAVESTNSYAPWLLSGRPLGSVLTQSHLVGWKRKHCSNLDSLSTSTAVEPPCSA